MRNFEKTRKSNRSFYEAEGQGRKLNKTKRGHSNKRMWAEAM